MTRIKQLISILMISTLLTMIFSGCNKAEEKKDYTSQLVDKVFYSWVDPYRFTDDVRFEFYEDGTGTASGYDVPDIPWEGKFTYTIDVNDEGSYILSVTPTDSTFENCKFTILDDENGGVYLKLSNRVFYKTRTDDETYESYRLRLANFDGTYGIYAQTLVDSLGDFKKLTGEEIEDVILGDTFYEYNTNWSIIYIGEDGISHTYTESQYENGEDYNPSNDKYWTITEDTISFSKEQGDVSQTQYSVYEIIEGNYLLYSEDRLILLATEECYVGDGHEMGIYYQESDYNEAIVDPDAENTCYVCGGVADKYYGSHWYCTRHWAMVKTVVDNS